MIDFRDTTIREVLAALQEESPAALSGRKHQEALGLRFSDGELVWQTIARFWRTNNMAQLNSPAFPGVPHPGFCHHAETCKAAGRCVRDPVCID